MRGVGEIFDEVRSIRERLAAIHDELNEERDVPGWDRVRSGRTAIYMSSAGLLPVQTAAECAALAEKRAE